MSKRNYQGAMEYPARKSGYKKIIINQDYNDPDSEYPIVSKQPRVVAANMEQIKHLKEPLKKREDDPNHKKNYTVLDYQGKGVIVPLKPPKSEQKKKLKAAKPKKKIEHIWERSLPPDYENGFYF